MRHYITGLLSGITLILLVAFGITSCNEKQAATLREIGSALLSDLIADLATPESMTELLGKPKEERLKFVLDKAEARANMLAVQCRGAIETGDPKVLEGWLDEAIPALAPLLKTDSNPTGKYSAKDLQRGLERIDPRLAGTLAAALPKALAYLADRPAQPEKGIYPIPDASLEGLVVAWGSKDGAHPLVITDYELVLFGDLLDQCWRDSAPPVIESGSDE